MGAISWLLKGTAKASSDIRLRRGESEGKRGAWQRVERKKGYGDEWTAVGGKSQRVDVEKRDVFTPRRGGHRVDLGCASGGRQAGDEVTRRSATVTAAAVQPHFSGRESWRDGAQHACDSEAPASPSSEPINASFMPCVGTRRRTCELVRSASECRSVGALHDSPRSRVNADRSR